MGRKKKEEQKFELKLDRKMQRFLDNNFPPYNEAIVTENNAEVAIIILDYGYREPKMQVTVDRTGGDVYTGGYKLADTKFLD